MEAKDTVMPNIKLETICNNWGQSIIPKDRGNNLPLSIAQYQAEITWNKVREVVKGVENTEGSYYGCDMHGKPHYQTDTSAPDYMGFEAGREAILKAIGG